MSLVVGVSVLARICGSKAIKMRIDAHKGIQEIPENARIIDTTDTMIIDMDYDELYNKILSVKGVGPALCERILDKLYEEYDGYINDSQDNPE